MGEIGLVMQTHCAGVVDPTNLCLRTVDQCFGYSETAIERCVALQGPPIAILLCIIIIYIYSRHPDNCVKSTSRYYQWQCVVLIIIYYSIQ